MMNHRCFPITAYLTHVLEVNIKQSQAFPLKSSKVMKFSIPNNHVFNLPIKYYPK